jgi:hypothetical protein
MRLIAVCFHMQRHELLVLFCLALPCPPVLSCHVVSCLVFVLMLACLNLFLFLSFCFFFAVLCCVVLCCIVWSGLVASSSQPTRQTSRLAFYCTPPISSFQGSILQSRGPRHPRPAPLVQQVLDLHPPRPPPLVHAPLLGKDIVHLLPSPHFPPDFHLSVLSIIVRLVLVLV